MAGVWACRIAREPISSVSLLCQTENMASPSWTKKMPTLSHAYLEGAGRRESVLPPQESQIAFFAYTLLAST